MWKSSWGWMLVAFLIGGWLPPASHSLSDDTPLDVYEGFSSSLKARVHHLAVTRDAGGRPTRIVLYLGNGEFEEAPPPNPWLSSGLSLVVPGAGQAYLGDWPRGAIFFGASLLLGGLALGLKDSHQAWGKGFGVALLGVSLAAPLDAFWMTQRCVAP